MNINSVVAVYVLTLEMRLGCSLIAALDGYFSELRNFSTLYDILVVIL